MNINKMSLKSLKSEHLNEQWLLPWAMARFACCWGGGELSLDGRTLTKSGGAGNEDARAVASPVVSQGR